MYYQTKNKNPLMLKWYILGLTPPLVYNVLHCCVSAGKFINRVFSVENSIKLYEIEEL